MLKPTVILSSDGVNHDNATALVTEHIEKFKALGISPFEHFKRNIKLSLKYNADSTWSLEVLSPVV